MQILLKTATVTALLAASIPLTAQTKSVMGTVDTAVLPPRPTLPARSAEAAALNELRAYRATVGATHWLGLQSDATIKYDADENAPSYSATVSLSRSGQTRLDVVTPSGTRGLRIDGLIGGSQVGDDPVTNVPLRNCAVGLVAFPKLLSSDPANATMSVTDGGMVSLDNQELHKISIQYLITSVHPNPSDERTHIVSDLYFGPDHLLYKSASLVEAIPWSAERYLEVVSYSDYRWNNGVQIPFHMRDTLDGQVNWDLQLTSIRELTASTEFSF
jgi:hypothetical protein